MWNIEYHKQMKSAKCDDNQLRVHTVYATWTIQHKKIKKNKRLKANEVSSIMGFDNKRYDS